MSERRERLIREFRDAEYRESYAEHHVNSILATQIRTVREQRGLTQERLARKIDKQQAAISRIENVNYARWNISTLKKVAGALGCWLDIRLSPWGKLVDAVDEYSTENLRCDRFEDDPVFWGSVAKGPVPEAVRWVQQKLLPWLGSHPEGDPMLIEWLQGRGLPPLGDFDPPHVWIVRAIGIEGPGSRHLALLRGWLARQIPAALRIARPLNDPNGFLTGLFNLAAAFHLAELFWEPLHTLYLDLRAGAEDMPEEAKAAFLNALVRNQQSFELKSQWLETIESGAHAVLPANEWDAFEGLKWIPSRPNLRAIAEGLKAMQIAAWKRPEAGIDIVLVMRDVRNTFRDFAQLDQLLWREGKDVSWQEEVVDAWFGVFAPSPDDQIAVQQHWTGKPDRAISSESLKRTGDSLRRVRKGEAGGGQSEEQLEEDVNKLKACQKEMAMAAGAGPLPPTGPGRRSW